MLRSRLVRVLADIQEHAGSHQRAKQTRTTVADERQRNAFGREQADHHAEIDQGLADDHGGDADRQIFAELVGGFHGGDKAAPAVYREKREDDDRADEAEFFADDGVDKIGVGFGQEEKFLAAFHQADAGHAAGTNGDERLQELEASALRVAVGMEERFKTRQAVRHANDEQIYCGNGGEQRAADIFVGQAGDVEHDHADNHDHEGGTHVRFFNDQRGHGQNGAQSGGESSPEVVDAKFSGRAARFQKPGEKNDQRELGHFRRLKAEGAQAKPAMGGMRAIQKINADQTDERHGESGENDARLAQLAVIGVHQGEHAGDAEDDVDELAQQENVAGAEFILGGHGRGAEDHHRADEAQGQGDDQELFVGFEAAWHVYPFSVAAGCICATS